MAAVSRAFSAIDRRVSSEATSNPRAPAPGGSMKYTGT